MSRARDREERKADAEWAFDVGHDAFANQWTTARVGEWMCEHPDLTGPFMHGMETADFDLTREGTP